MVRLSSVSEHWLEEGSVAVSVTGAWLREFGFEAGKKVVVDITDGQIVIKVVECED